MDLIPGFICRFGLHIARDEPFHSSWWVPIPSGYAWRARWHCSIQKLPEVHLLLSSYLISQPETIWHSDTCLNSCWAELSEYEWYWGGHLIFVRSWKTGVIVHWVLRWLRRWGSVEFPLPFGRTMSPAENLIHRMDEKVTSKAWTDQVLLSFYCMNPELKFKRGWAIHRHSGIVAICTEAAVLHLYVFWTTITDISWLHFSADRGIPEVDNIEPKGAHLDHGCWRWCKCNLCRHGTCSPCSQRTPVVAVIWSYTCFSFSTTNAL